MTLTLIDHFGQIAFKEHVGVQKGDQVLVLDNLKKRYKILSQHLYTLKGITTEGKELVNEKVIFE